MRADLIVIGAGAAGMMAAGTAAERGFSVILLEKNDKLGKKINITGKGRCNLTNNCPPEEFLKNVPTNPKFLFSAINAFSPEDTMSFFEEHGLPLKTERGNRVFPVSDNAFHVTDTLRTYLQKTGVKVVNASAKHILVEDGRVTGVETDRGRFDAGAAVLATGGASYPTTGSTGDGYIMAEELGHTIRPIQASLVPLESPDAFCERLMGLSLRNVTVTLRNKKGKAEYTELGEMLFTHFGLSGPLILSASSHMREQEGTVYIDLKPGLDDAKLEKRILSDFEKYKNREFRNALYDLFPTRLAETVAAQSGIPGNTQVNSVTREQRQALKTLIKAFPVQISGRRPIAEAIITSGGIATKEIDPHTMQSKLVGGLYFAGEIIDVDAYTGGFNLQIAWSTGRAAGRSIGRNEGK